MNYPYLTHAHKAPLFAAFMMISINKRMRKHRRKHKRKRKRKRKHAEWDSVRGSQSLGWGAEKRSIRLHSYVITRPQPTRLRARFIHVILRPFRPPQVV